MKSSVLSKISHTQESKGQGKPANPKVNVKDRTRFRLKKTRSIRSLMKCSAPENMLDAQATTNDIA